MVNGRLVIPAGSTRGMTFCFDVVINGDDSREGDELFSVIFEFLNSNDEMLGSEMVAITIVDGT